MKKKTSKKDELINKGNAESDCPQLSETVLDSSSPRYKINTLNCPPGKSPYVLTMNTPPLDLGELFTRVADLLKEIKELSRYKELLSDREHGSRAHVAFVQHWGNISEYLRVDFHQKYNELFIPIFDDIINKLKDELSSL